MFEHASVALALTKRCRPEGQFEAWGTCLMPVSFLKPEWDELHHNIMLFAAESS